MTGQQRGSQCLPVLPSLSFYFHNVLGCAVPVLTDLEAVHHLSLSSQPPIVSLIKDDLKIPPVRLLLGRMPAPCRGRQRQAPGTLAHGDTWALVGGQLGTGSSEEGGGTGQDWVG